MIRERILELCKLHNIAVSNLEIELGLSKAAVSKWDKSSPRAESLKKVAEYFNVSVDYLLGRTDINGRYIPQSLDDPMPELIHAAAGNQEHQRAELEQKVVDLYNSMPPEMQKTALAQLEALAAMNKK